MGYIIETLFGVASVRGVLDSIISVFAFIMFVVDLADARIFEYLGFLFFTVFAFVIYIAASIHGCCLCAEAFSDNPGPFLLRYNILSIIVFLCAIIEGFKYIIEERLIVAIIFFIYGVIVLITLMLTWLTKIEAEEEQRTARQTTSAQETVVISSGRNQIPQFDMPVHVERAEVREMEPMNSKSTEH